MRIIKRFRCHDLRVVFLVALTIFFPACGSGPTVQGIALPPDMDGDGIPDAVDNDLDGDGIRNQIDTDIDGDGLQNWADPDADNDQIPNVDDETPFGPWLPTPQTLQVTAGVATINFGDVPVGHTAGPGTIHIENDSASSQTISRVALVGTGGGVYSIDTSTLPGASFALAPGQAVSFTAQFKPAAGVPALGRVEVDIGPAGAAVTGVVHLLGQGTAPALLTSGAPSTINFGDVPVGVSAGPGVATLVNDTAAAVDVTRLALTGTGGGTFVLSLAPVPGGSVPFTLAPGAQAVFHVFFTPVQGLAAVGAVELDLSTGTTLALDLLGQGVAPAMLVTPASADFGAALAGAEARELTVSVSNAFFANGNLTVSAIDFPEDAGGDFTLPLDPTPFSIPPGGAPVTITVRFEPDAASTGTRSGALRMFGNDPLIGFERTVELSGEAAAWRAPASPIAMDLTVPAGANVAQPTWLAGSTRIVMRSAGPDGFWGGLLADDQIVVMDADPDGDPTTLDARVIVRWSGFALTPAPAGAVVDAGNGRHVFFLDGGFDGTVGSADDSVRILDTLSGDTRARACPNPGLRKSRPVIVDGSSSRVVVATGTGGGPLPSADTLLIYENLLGDLTSTTPTETVALEVAVPDLLCCTPVVMGATTVVMPVADASSSPDLSDRTLDDADAGLVQVRGLGSTIVVERLELLRALTEAAAPSDGDTFCTPVKLNASSLVLATEGVDALSTVDDEILRIDGVGTAALSVAAFIGSDELSGAGSQLVALGGGFFAFAAPGQDGTYGTSDDGLFRFDASLPLALNEFGPGTALAGAGGVGTRPVPFGGLVLVSSLGSDGVVGGGDDEVLQLDPSLMGAAGVRAQLPVPGGLFDGDRVTSTSLSGPRRLDDRFVCIADRGVDLLAGTADDILRVYRDKDGNGVLGEVADDLGLDGAFDVADSVGVPIPGAHGSVTPVGVSPAAHIVTVEPGANGSLGNGGDDVPTVWWLRGSALLP